MSDVKRFDPWYSEGGCMDNFDNGDYVLYSDYAALQAELDNTRFERTDAVRKIDELEAENARLKAPMSDEEWADRCEPTWNNSAATTAMSRENIDALIAARVVRKEGL